MYQQPDESESQHQLSQLALLLQLALQKETEYV